MDGNEYEAGDHIDREWESIGTDLEAVEVRDELWEAGNDSPGDALALDAAESGDWSVFEDAATFGTDADVSGPDEDDQDKEDRDNLGGTGGLLG